MQSSPNALVKTGGNIVPFPGGKRPQQGSAGQTHRLGAQVSAMAASFAQLHAGATGLREHTAALAREAANAAAAIRSVVEALKSFDPAALLRGATLAELRARG